MRGMQIGSCKRGQKQSQVRGRKGSQLFKVPAVGETLRYAIRLNETRKIEGKGSWIFEINIILEQTLYRKEKLPSDAPWVKKSPIHLHLSNRSRDH